jgi:UDP-glucose 4-epimerase
MNKLLITGSNGFVGSYFINKYKKKYDITTFSFLKGTIDTLHCSDVDVVFHLSALVHQMNGASKNEYEKVNVHQTIELAKKAKLCGVSQFIFMSSVKVYGEEADFIYNEETNCQPIDPYGESKLKAEKELLTLQDDNFKVSIIRTPIVYGNGVKANIKSLVKLIKKVPILPFASIENKRSMVYIGNLCSMVETVIDKKINGIYLACDDTSLSTSELIQLIAKSLNKKIYLVKLPFFEFVLKLIKPSFHSRLYGSLEINNDLSKKNLDFKNPYCTEDGIINMIHGEIN